jgi:crossover junction endodeoxyribonuclease RuvC
MVILGIDPGTATTGFGIIKNKSGKSGIFEPIRFGVITTPAQLDDAERLMVLAADLEMLITTYHPQVVGVERLFFTTNQKTAMQVAQARGVVLLVAQQHSLKIQEFTPLQVKSIICGYGKASKKQMQYMVQQTFALPEVPKPDDAADALAIALCAGLVQKQSSRR